ncbi:MAG: Rieske (2Fe-2S) protein [Candidatus Nanopelagicales bacterium]|nr:Rieske (2Fe-2S) protein [Candidatus Nanopelagicales bacterium]
MTDLTAMPRRTVLAGTGLIAVGVAVAACSSAEVPVPDAPVSATASAGAADGGATVLTPLADVPVGGGVVISTPPIVVTQPKAGQVQGFTAICPHAGCLVATVERDEIICPCHGSRFSAVDGSVIQGPAEQGLAAAAVSVQGANVVLA